MESLSFSSDLGGVTSADAEPPVDTLGVGGGGAPAAGGGEIGAADLVDPEGAPAIVPAGLVIAVFVGLPAPVSLPPRDPELESEPPLLPELSLPAGLELAFTLTSGEDGVELGD